MYDFFPPITAAIVTVVLTSIVAYIVFRARNVKRVQIEIPYEFKRKEITVVVVNTGSIPVTVRSMGFSSPIIFDKGINHSKPKWVLRVLNILRIGWLFPYYGEHIRDSYIEFLMSRGQSYCELLNYGEMLKLEPGESATRTTKSDVLSSFVRNPLESDAEVDISVVLLFPYCRLVGVEGSRWGSMVVFVNDSTHRDSFIMAGGLKLT